MTTQPSAPVEPETHRLLAWLQQGGNLGDLLRLSPQDLNVLYSIGHSLFEEGRQQAALGVFGALAAFDPSQARFHHAVATCLQRMGRFRDAARSYVLLKLLEPDNPETLFRLAECLLAEGERESAAGMLDAIVQESDPANSPWRVRAEALLRLLKGAESVAPLVSESRPAGSPQDPAT